MDTIENNKLIAEFMEVQNIVPTEKTGTKLTMYKPMMNWYREDELRYHTSWDWLMPVVENIDHLEWESERLDKIDNAIKSRVIGDVYKAVVEFIKWYNKSK